jgi:hypothetical protein
MKTKEECKFPQKVMVWLRMSSKGVITLVIFDEGSVDYDQCIHEILPMAADLGERCLVIIGAFNKTMQNSIDTIYLKSDVGIICPRLSTGTDGVRTALT